MESAQESTSDHALLRAWRGGDRLAGQTLVERHSATLYRFFRNRTDENLGDLAQRTFLACVEGRSAPSESVSFRAFLLGIARNKLLHHYRKHEREGRALQLARAAGEAAPHSPSQVVAVHQEQRLLLRAVRRLPLELQMAVELFYWEGLKIEEIAAVFELSPSGIKSRLARARELLRDLIGEVAGDPELRRSTCDNLEHWARSLRELAADETPEAEPER